MFGVGHLGKIHLECLTQTPFEVIGFFDPDDSRAQKTKDHFNIPRYLDEDVLMKSCDVVDIVTPTIHHFNLAMKALKYGKHVFIEKPIAFHLKEAEMLVKEVRDSGLKAQVGHVERYNPAFTSLAHDQIKPMFIEAHRLVTFNNRGYDVSVVMDLMIHDLDLIMSLAGRDVVDIRANGINVIGDTPDICNARLTFANGCVANITASRISMKNMRKIRLFQKNTYISIDFLEKESQIITLEDQYTDDVVMPLDTANGKKYVALSSPMVEGSNAIVDELMDFHSTIINNLEPKVSIEDGYHALLLAKRIEEELKLNIN